MRKVVFDKKRKVVFDGIDDSTQRMIQGARARYNDRDNYRQEVLSGDFSRIPYSLPVINKRKRDAVMAMADPKQYQATVLQDPKKLKEESDSASLQSYDQITEANMLRMGGQTKQADDMLAKGRLSAEMADEYSRKADITEVELDQQERQQKISELQAVVNAADFAQYAQKGAADKGNNVEYVHKNTDEIKHSLEGQYGTRKLKYRQLTDQERQIYNYYIGKGDKKKAKAYLDAMDRVLDKRETGELNKERTDFAKDHKIGGLIMNLNSSFDAGAATETIAQNVKNAVTGKSEPVNPYSDLMQNAQAKRATTEGLLDGTSGIGRFLGQVGLSGLQSVSRIPFGPVMGAAISSIGAGGDASMETAEKGGSAGQSLKMGTAIAGAEYLSEKWSLGNLLDIGGSAAKKSLKEIFKDIVKQAGVEGSEELVSEYAGLLADQAIMRDKAEINQYKQQLIDQGVDPDRAQKQALMQYAVLNPMAAFVGGTLSGGVMGAGASAVSEVNTRRAGRNINQSGQLDTLIDQGLQAPKGSDLYNAADTLRQQAETGKLSNRDIGQFARMMQEGTPEIEPQQGEKTASRELYQTPQNGTIQAEYDGLQTTTGGVEDGGLQKSAGIAQEIFKGTDGRGFGQTGADTGGEATGGSGRGELYQVSERKTPFAQGEYRKIGDSRIEVAQSREVYSQICRNESLTTKQTGEGLYSYRPAHSISENASAVQSELTKLGIESQVIDGELAVNVDNKTIVSWGEASTIIDGTVFVRNNTDLNPQNIAGHEMYHVVQKKSPQVAGDFYNAITDGNINYSDENIRNLLTAIIISYRTGNKQDGGRSFNFVDNYDLVFPEMVAWLSGDMNENDGKIPPLYSSSFQDIAKIESAWTAMKESLGRSHEKSGGSSTGKRFIPLPQFKKGADGVIRRVDDAPTTQPQKIDTDNAVSDVLKNDKLSPRVKETVRELEGTVYEDTRIIPEDIAQRLKNPDGAYNKDLSRVLDSTATDKETREVLRDKIERPLWQAKGEYATEVTNILNGYYDDMKRLGIKMGSKESAAVQWYGEGQRQVNKGKGSVEIESYTLADLRRDFPDTWENIVEADRINRSIYDKMLQRDNAALKEIYPNVEQRALSRKNLLEHRIRQDTAELSKADVVTNPGYVRDLRNALNKNKKELAQLKADIESGEIFRNKRILPRKDYYHHFIEMEQGLGGLKNILSSSHDIDPELVGVSEFTKPKSKWAGFMQKRKGGQYVEDSVAAMVKYVPAAQYKASIDPQIARIRAIVRDVAAGTKDTRNANKFIEWATDYAGDLAGKTIFLDRTLEKLGNRKFLKGLEWLNNRVKANAISLNLSSAISQWFNLPNGVGYVKNPVDMAKGVADYCKMIAGNSEVRTEIDQSIFLKERYVDNVIDRFDHGVLSAPGKLANWLMEVGDKQAAQIIWFSAHEQGKRKGVSNPAEYADDITRRSVAGRGIGEIPMTQKSRVIKLLAPFQVEVNNSYQILKEKFKEKDAMGLMAIFLASWLMNGISEALVGRRVAFDPIDAIADAVKEVQEGGGSPLQKATKVTMRLGGEILSNVPYGSQIAESSLGLTDYEAEDVFGDSDPTRYGTGNIGLTTITKPLISAARGKDIDVVDPIAGVVLPRGGKQLARSLRAAQDLGYVPKEHINLNTGVSFEQRKTPGIYGADGSMKTPIDTNPGNVALALAFGPYGTKEGKEYLQSGQKGLSAERTAQMVEAYEEADIPPKVFFEAYRATKDMKADKRADGSTINGSKAAKIDLYVESIEGLNSAQRKKLKKALK
ncbi:Uncharacterised protein [Anaerotruncus sp. 2789STDY5834896]|uniref:Large polyvalent protein associated domain-containing protein n=1 Tax=uncultured Anaerotruncus sp. TaxID=905011 RepID=A0A1C6FRT2_9FIRM|nr:Uncharacterised protein [uncultured Anaerotruncus sp.]